MCRCKLLIAGLVLLLTGPLVAQNIVNDSTASVIAYWEVGDQRSYDVQRVKTGAHAGSSTYTMALRVLDATDSTYQLECVLRDLRVDAELPSDPRDNTDSTYQLECVLRDLRVDAELPSDPRDKAVFQKLLNASNGLRIVCTTDETGIPLSLANMSEVEEHAKQALLGILDLALDPSERLQMRRALEPVLDAEVLAQDALEDLGNLLFPFGVAYITGRKEEVQAEALNPLGGEPIGTEQTFTMTALDTTAHTARMRMEQHIDPKAVDDAIDSLIESSGGAGLTGDAREKFRRQIESIRVNETMDIDVDLNGAWTTRLVLVRESAVHGVSEKDTRTYTLRSPRP